jgi:hypothetical protein
MNINHSLILPSKKTILHHKKVIGFGIHRKIHGIKQLDKNLKSVATNQIGIGTVFKPNQTGDKVKIGGRIIGVDVDRQLNNVGNAKLNDLKKINFAKMKKENIKFVI